MWLGISKFDWIHIWAGLTVIIGIVLAIIGFVTIIRMIF